MLTKSASRKRAQRAIPLPKNCERCGCESNRLHRHHGNHQNALYVVILCPQCHADVGAKIGERRIKKEKICVMCGRSFREYSHSRVKTCGKACLSELGRRNALKRWTQPAPSDSRRSETPPCPSGGSASKSSNGD